MAQKNNTNGAGAAVSVAKDQRHFDGDFFRAWDIAGNVTIRNNTIRDAFNGIHFFNRVDLLDHGVTGDPLLFNGHRRSPEGFSQVAPATRRHHGAFRGAA